MKNILGALAILALGGFAMTAPASASPAASLASVGEQAAPAVEQVHYHGKRFYGKYYWGYRPHYRGYKSHYYGGRHHYRWRKHHYGYNSYDYGYRPYKHYRRYDY